MRRGIPIVISAASGTGKTQHCLRLLATLSHVARSVSYTTRAPRRGELNGTDYHFVDPAEFGRMIQADEFIEWAEVYGSRYGTGLQAVEGQLAEGLDVLLDIDVQGARQLKRQIPNALLIFLLPPSIDELRRRLLNRATELPEAVERRLASARAEIEASTIYDYVIVNDDFDKAASDLRAIVTAERLRADRPTQLIAELLAIEPSESNKVK